MLPKPNRLKKKKDIERVFKSGKGFKKDFLVLKVVKNDLKNSRFAFIVSQKVSKKATLRNKIRRRLSELVRRHPATTRLGMDIVLVATPGLEEKDFWEIEEAITKIFAKAKILETKNQKLKIKNSPPTNPSHERGNISLQRRSRLRL